MARTSITAYSDYQLPDTYVSKANPTITDLSDAAWQLLNLELTLTVGATQVYVGKQVKLHYAFSDNELAPSVAASGLSPVGKLEGVVQGAPTAVTALVSQQIEITGDYLYTWLEIPDPLPGDITAKLEVVQVASGGSAADQAPYDVESVTGTVTLDLTDGVFQKMSATGNITLNAPDSGSEGKLLKLWITPTGADRTLNFHADIKIPTDSGLSLPKMLTQDKLYIVLLQHNGTNWMLNSLVGGY